ncbi:MAG TPA: hypothetical protein VMF32_23085 [Xanthobacteraceae bacterium]|nr:hypothetical protein [Xanthobacteraceae bacterium]
MIRKPYFSSILAFAVVHTLAMANCAVAGDAVPMDANATTNMAADRTITYDDFKDTTVRIPTLIDRSGEVVSYKEVPANYLAGGKVFDKSYWQARGDVATVGSIQASASDPDADQRI